MFLFVSGGWLSSERKVGNLLKERIFQFVREFFNLWENLIILREKFQHKRECFNFWERKKSKRKSRRIFYILEREFLSIWEKKISRENSPSLRESISHIFKKITLHLGNPETPTQNQQKSHKFHSRIPTTTIPHNHLTNYPLLSSLNRNYPIKLFQLFRNTKMTI